eukprot:10262812-Prorocentrum_lima.AAC.1
MTSSLVGSEMCIRDRACTAGESGKWKSVEAAFTRGLGGEKEVENSAKHCLLYTSDAADDM